MANLLNRPALARLDDLIKSGDFVDRPFKFTAKESNELLGEPQNFAEFSRWFLGKVEGTPDLAANVPSGIPPRKDWWTYPFSADGKKVNLSALRSIISQASAAGDSSIKLAARAALQQANNRTADLAKASSDDAGFIRMVSPVTILAAERDLGSDDDDMEGRRSGASVRAKARPRKFQMEAYTGGAMTLEGFKYPVVVDVSGLKGTDKSRPIFLNHDKSAIVGHTDSIRASAKDLCASGVISGAGPAAKQVLDSHDSGFPWQASIGARPDKMEFVPEGQTGQANGQTFNGPVNIARKATLGEISMVPLGADENTSVRIAAARKKNMSIENDSAVLVNEDISTERERASAIAASCAKYPSIGVEKLAKIQATAISEGWDSNKVELECIRAARPDSQRINTAFANSPDMGQTITAAMCMTAGMSEKAVAKSCGGDERLMNAALSAQFKNFGLHSLIRATIRAAGRPAPEHIDRDTIRTAFEADRFLRAGAGAGSGGFSTMSLSNVIANVQNKYALQTYESTATTWDMFCATSDLKDFKPGLRIRLTGAGSFFEISTGGNLPMMSLQDQGFNIQAKAEGAIINIPYQTIVNDDTAALTATPKILARQAAIALEKAVYKVLLGNASSFFGTGNSNILTGGGSALSIDALTAAESLFLKQTDPNGDPTLIAPKVILVPPELNVTAATLVRSEEIRNTTANDKYPTVNPHAGRFQAAASPWLSNAQIAGNSAIGWYLLTDGSDIACIEVGFLQGQRAPTIESGETDFSTLGISTRAYFSFGVALQDPRGGVFNAGA
jgi:hypothetical protein